MRSLLLALLLSSSLCYSQTAKEKTIAYYDADWKTSDSTNASYYRTVESKVSNYIVRDYFKSGKMQMEAHCSLYTPSLEYDGKKTLYYENGQVKSETTYYQGKATGQSRSFYENGSLQSEVVYNEENKGLPLYRTALTLDGQDLIPGGKGIIPEEVGNQKQICYSDIENFLPIGSFVIEAGNDTLYNIAEKQAEYKGGLSQMAADLGARLRYPKSARRQGVEGAVFVAFVVDKKGNVSDPKVIKGISTDCDEEAVRVVRTLNNWYPARHRNKVVKSRFVLPIRYKLTL